MLYIICPTCGTLLGNKEVPYFEGLMKLCEKYKIDDNLVSLDEYDENSEFGKAKQKLLDDLVGKDNVCCAARLPNVKNLAELIKG
jgi:DNA-directed RNA polymerase subunit N (RpoN/RPB10)